MTHKAFRALVIFAAMAPVALFAVAAAKFVWWTLGLVVDAAILRFILAAAISLPVVAFAVHPYWRWIERSRAGRG